MMPIDFTWLDGKKYFQSIMNVKHDTFYGEEQWTIIRAWHLQIEYEFYVVEILESLDL